MGFRPLFWPSLMCLLGLLVLLGLGVWQLERREWKLDLIATMDARLAAPPVTLETLEAEALREDVAYRSVVAAGRFDHAREIYWFTTGPDGAPGYHVVTPLLRTGARAVLIDRGFVPEALRDPATRPAGQVEGLATVTGHARLSDRPGPFTPSPDRARGIWYVRDVEAMAAEIGVAPSLPFFIEADATPNPGGWPLGGQTAVRLRNDHLSYAITWFSLAAALVVIYLLYHRAQGRFGPLRAPSRRDP